MATSLERSEKKKVGSIIYDNTFTIWWKCDGNRSSKSCDNWSPRNH